MDIPSNMITRLSSTEPRYLSFEKDPQCSENVITTKEEVSQIGMGSPVLVISEENLTIGMFGGSTESSLIVTDATTVLDDYNFVINGASPYDGVRTSEDLEIPFEVKPKIFIIGAFNTNQKSKLISTVDFQFSHLNKRQLAKASLTKGQIEAIREKIRGWIWPEK